MNGFMIFITGGIGIFIGAFILSIKILFELSEENKRNRERIDYLVVKYADMKRRLERLEGEPEESKEQGKIIKAGRARLVKGGWDD